MSAPMLPSTSLPTPALAPTIDAGHSTPGARTHKPSLSEHSSPLPFFPRRDSPLSTPVSPRSIPRKRVDQGLTHSRSLSHAGTSLDHSSNLHGNGVDVPVRTTSLRRKPVPGLLPMLNTTLPSTHPFAAGAVSSEQTTPHSPGERADEDLFFRVPRSGPLPPWRPRPESLQSHNSGNDAREELFRAREEALRAREENLRQREEMWAKEEALRLREESLRRREEALLRRDSVTPASLDGHGSAWTEPSRLATPLPLASPMLFRPLPPVPDPSRPDLNASTESFPAPVTPSTTHTTPLSRGLHLFAKRNRRERPSSPAHVHTVPSPAASVKEPASEAQPFSVDALPSQENMLEAGTLFLRDESGQVVCFGDLFPHPHSPSPNALPGDVPSGAEDEDLPPITRTVVFFIRHFWCGQCQDYTLASLATLDPLAVRRAGVRVVVVSNGSWKIIKAYRRVLKCPFPIYVDGPRKLYHLLGMTKMTNDFGPLFKGRAEYHQRSVPGQLLHGGANALFRFPLADPGKLTQLGGEFIFSAGYTCDFAHRMTTTSDHMEAPDVMRLAGVAAPTISEAQSAEIEKSQRAELDLMAQEMEVWRREREAEIHRLRRYKAERRGLIYDPTVNNSKFGLGHSGTATPDVGDPYQIGDQILAPTEKSRHPDSVTIDSEMAAEMERMRIASDQVEQPLKRASGVEGAERGSGQGLIMDVAQ